MGPITSENFNVSNFFLIFFKPVQQIGGTICFFWAHKAKIDLKNREWTQKSTFFAKVDTRVLTILGVKKVFLWTFFKVV